MKQTYLNEGLIEACNNGDLDAVKYFIRRGADVNCKNNQMRHGNLGPAIDNCGHEYDKIKCLVENGAKVSRHCLIRSFDARSPKLTRFLVEKGGAKLEADDVRYAASWEIRVNNIEVIKYVLKAHKPCIPVFLDMRRPFLWEDLSLSTRQYRWDGREDEYNQRRRDIINLREELLIKVGNVLENVEV